MGPRQEDKLIRPEGRSGNWPRWMKEEKIKVGIQWKNEGLREKSKESQKRKRKKKGKEDGW